MVRVPGRILIVDDEPPLLRMMSLYLGRMGYSVTTTNSTEEAWSLVEADPGAFAAAILDGSMPGMTMEELGLRLLRVRSSFCVLAASGSLDAYAGNSSRKANGAWRWIWPGVKATRRRKDGPS